MAHEYKVTWRAFYAGGRNAPIATTWNVRSWPHVYVLDHNGVIRYRGLYGHDIVEAVETLLAE